MKNVLRIPTLLITIILATGMVYSRPRKNSERLPREQFAQKQAVHIAEALLLDSVTNKKFIATYLEYQKEIWELGGRNRTTNTITATDEQTDSAILARFDHSQKILDIRRKYYNKYNQFLTPKQIDRMYQQERNIMRRLHNRHSNRKK